MSKDSRVSCKIEAGSRRLPSITPIGFPLCLLLNPALIAVKSLVLVLWGKISIFSSLPLQTKVPSFNYKDERSLSVFSKAFLIAAVAIRSPTSPSPERLRLRAATSPRRTGIKKRMLGKSEVEEMLNPPVFFNNNSLLHGRHRDQRSARLPSHSWQQNVKRRWRWSSSQS